MKITEVIFKLEAWHAPIDHPEHTSDTIKYGDPEAECTGVAVTCFTSVDVVRKAAALGCNFIICHEPMFFSHNDKTEWLAGNPVYEAKRKLLNETGIVVWRDHDHIHGPGGPMATVHEVTDWVYYGIMKELGWEDYAFGEETKPLWFKLPETTVQALAGELMENLNLVGMRIVGDSNTKVSTVFLCEHVFGMPDRDKDIIRKAVAADVMIPLEIVDWTLSEYIRDAVQLGMAKVILEMGHFNIEELGMKYMAEVWLPEVIGRAAPVFFIQSGDSFNYMKR